MSEATADELNGDPATVIETKSKKRRLPPGVGMALKLGVTGALIWLIVRNVEWGEFRENLRSYSWGVIGFVIFLWAVMLFLSSAKWDVLLRVHGLKYAYWTLTKWYTICNFFNQLLPSMIGGDAYRIMKTLGNGKHRACAVLPVFIERVTGLSALLVMGWIAAGVDWFERGGEVSGWCFAGGSAWVLCAIVGAAMWFGGGFKRLAEFKRCPSAIKSLIKHGDEYNRSPGKMFWAIVISFVFHGMRVWVAALLLWGLGAEVTLLQVTVVTAATTVIGMLPISLGGWGLVDGAFIGLMVLYGVPKEDGLTAQIMLRVTVLWVAVLGGVIYALDRGHTEHGAVASSPEVSPPEVSPPQGPAPEASA